MGDHMIKAHHFTSGQYRIICTCGEKFSNPLPGNAYVAYRDHAVAAREAEQTEAVEVEQ